MLGFNRMDIIQRVILLITAVLITIRCFFPVSYYYFGERMERLSLSAARESEHLSNFAELAHPVVDIPKTVFECIGIAIIGGVLFYILGGKKKKEGGAEGSGLHI